DHAQLGSLGLRDARLGLAAIAWYRRRGVLVGSLAGAFRHLVLLAASADPQPVALSPGASLAPSDDNARDLVQQQRPADRQSVSAILLARRSSDNPDRPRGVVRAQDLRPDHRRHRPFRVRT